MRSPRDPSSMCRPRSTNTHTDTDLLLLLLRRVQRLLNVQRVAAHNLHLLVELLWGARDRRPARDVLDLGQLAQAQRLVQREDGRGVRPFLVAFGAQRDGELPRLFRDALLRLCVFCLFDQQETGVISTRVKQE